ncbi:MAG: right-handed parallel beta-helix repeat-containing protein [Armatimonadota bacterium]
MKRSILLIVILLMCSAVVHAKELSVKDYGAIGDGKADETAAFQKAVAATPQGGQIRVPAGKYRINGTLELKMVTLIGADAGSWVGDNPGLPTLLPESTSGPCVRLLASGAVHGLGFEYNWQGKEPSALPACIELAGIGNRVSDCKIFNAWDGIMADGKTNVGRALVQNCFIVDVHNIGVRMTGTWDVSWISKVEVWSPGSKRFLSKGVGFLLGKNDILNLSDCFAFSAQTGYKLVESIEGAKISGVTWATFSNCTSDFCGIGMEVDGAHTISIAGGTHWTHHNGLSIKGKGGQVRISGCEFASNGGAAVDISGGKVVTMAGCQFRRESTSFDAPALRITGGEAIAVSGCVMTSATKALDVDKSLKSVVLTGNVVKENVRPEATPQTPAP